MVFLANNWLYFVIAGIMAFVMFKGGCCRSYSDVKDLQDAHSHGRDCCGGNHHSTNNKADIEQEEYNQQDNQLDLVKDPICGMVVNPETMYTHTIRGITYYFCSETCKKEFIGRQNWMQNNGWT